MDFRDPKNQKMILAILGLFFLGYVWYVRIYDKTAAALKVKRAEYERLMADLKAVELKAKSFEGLKTEYQDLLGRYQSIELLLPEEKQVPALLQQLNSAGAGLQVRVVEVTPQGTSPAGFYNTAAFTLSLRGSYHAIGNFLAAVANFPFIVNVSQLALSQPAVTQQAAAAKNPNETVSASFRILTYYVREEEKLKKLELN